MNLYFENVNAIQLDLFEKYDEFSEMKTYLYKTNQRMQNIQRGAFKRIDDHAKHIAALYEEVESLKMDLDRMKKSSGKEAKKKVRYGCKCPECNYRTIPLTDYQDIICHRCGVKMIEDKDSYII